MRRPWKLLLVLGMASVPASSPVRADSTPSGLADRAWAATDAVLARHVDPPTRQGMLLAGLKALAREGHAPAPFALARRVSELKGPADLAPIMAEVLGSSRIPDGADGRSRLEDGVLPRAALGRPARGRTALGQGASGGRAG